MSEQEVIAKECRFAIHMPSRRTPDGETPDVHLIKEILHFPDGTTKPNVRFRKNFKRTFYVTQPPHRNHQQKKEYEPVEKLNRYECTQSDLPFHVAKALNKFTTRPQLRQLAESPYLYGSDISSSAIIKHEYATTWPDKVTPYRVAYFDIETDVLHKSDDPVMATLIFENKVLTVALKSFVENRGDPHAELQKRLDKYLSTYLDKFKLEVEFVLVDHTVDLIKMCIARAHEWSPDFLAIWNIDFDIPRILDTLKKYNVDPKDVFSDPRLPPELRFCKYKKGSTKKVTASGQTKPKNPSEQWHSLYCPAGFYAICAMCSYRFIRQGAQELAYYSLDFVLDHELGLRKLTFKETEGIVEEGTLDWHIYMQDRYPFEYIAYNIFDCIGMLELETRTNDLAASLPVGSGFTDFARFNSQTKKFADKYYFFLMDRECVLGTIGPVETPAEASPDEVPVEDDEVPEDGVLDEDGEPITKSEVMSLKNWIK